MGFNVEIEMKIPTLSSQTNGNVILLEYIYRIRPVYFVLIDQEVLFVSIYFTENIQLNSVIIEFLEILLSDTFYCNCFLFHFHLIS